MHRHSLRHSSLIQFVLASSLFVATTAQAVVINTQVTTQQTTAVNGTVDVLPTGQIDLTGKNVDAILVNGNVNNGGTVNIYPANIFSQAVLNDVGGVGINIVSAATPALGNATINVGLGSQIKNSGANAAILVQNQGATINNAGFIDSLGSAIIIQTGGANATLNNDINGFLSSVAVPLLVNEAGFTFNNDGSVMITTTDIDAVQLNKVFNNINHNGYIFQDGGSGVAHQGNGIHVGAGVNGTGNINTTQTSLIQILETGDGIYVQSVIGTLQNAGDIFTNEGSAIALGANLTSLNNAGVLESKAPVSATVFATAPITIGSISLPDGFVNNGDIAAFGGTLKAIDFTTFPSNVTFTMQDGSVRGSVYLGNRDSGGGSDVLVMSGGNIDGDVFSDATGTSSTLTFSGGTVNGTVNLLGTTGDTVNISGSAFVNQFVSDGNGTADTFNIDGGDFISILSDTDDTVNILSSFEFNGTYMQFIGELNIQNPGTVFTANGRIMMGTLITSATLTIDEGTTFVPNDLLLITAAPGIVNRGKVLVENEAVFDFSANTAVQWVNHGETVLGPNAVLNLTGNGAEIFQNDVGSSLVVDIFGPMGGPVTSGQLIVGSTLAGPSHVVNLKDGSFIEPRFSGFIPQGTSVDILTLFDGNGGDIQNDATVLFPASAVLHFDSNLQTITDVGQILRLTAERNSYVSLSTGPNLGVASVLDVLAQGKGPSNNDLYTLLSQLDQLPTVEGLNYAMDSLLPPFNYALIEASHIGMDSVFEGVTDRVWDVAWHHRNHGRRHHGRAHPRPVARAGQNMGGRNLFAMSGFWARPIGAYVQQDEHDNILGYHADAVGGAIGFDWGVTDCTTFGVAASYTNVNVEDDNPAPKDSHMQAWMGTAYGSFNWCHGIFMDAMIAGAYNQYDVNRVISVNQLFTGANASFNGSQWGGQADVGMALPKLPYFFAPFVRLKYVTVHMDDYTESGAGALNLTVQSNNSDEFMGGIGVRVANEFYDRCIDWVPEFTAMVGYDFHNDGNVTVASLAGAVPQFVTHGLTPASTLFDLGLGLNALYRDCVVVTVKYNLELRQDFYANSAYVQYFYNWG